MKTQIIKRDFFALILLLFTVFICYFILKNVTLEWKEVFDKFYAFTSQYEGNWYETKTYSFYEATFKDLNITYATTLSIFSFLLFIFIVLKNPEKIGLFLGILYLLFSWAIITDFNFTKIDIISSGDFKHNLYLMLALFSPYFYFIVTDTLIGDKIDITECIIETKNSETNQLIEELNILREQDIISTEQFEIKKTNILKEQFKTEFLITDEYKILLSLKEKGLFTTQEFNDKIEEVINKKLNS